MPKKNHCMLQKRIQCLFCHRPKTSAPSQMPKKSWLLRSTPIKPKSDRQKQLDRLQALLKIACLKRDKYQCVMCGKPATKHPIHPYDFLDVSHIFAKSVWPLARSQPMCAFR